jgi:hypothetical protein
MITWGQLAKSQTDPEKIEEAIQRLIAEHNADPEAHLVEGGSLQSHKMAEIIDHLVSSIIADKIKDGEVTPPKILSLLSNEEEVGHISDFSTWDSYVAGSGSVTKRFKYNEVATGSTINSIASIYLKFGNYPGYSGPYRFDFKVYIEEYINEGMECYIKFGGGNYLPNDGNVPSRCFGFKLTAIEIEEEVYEVKVEGFVRNYFGVSYVTLATNLQVTEAYVLSIDWVGDTFNFYIDGVLKGQIVKTQMTPWGTEVYLVHAIKNNVAGDNRSLLTQVAYKVRY